MPLRMGPYKKNLPTPTKTHYPYKNLPTPTKTPLTPTIH